MGLNGPHRRIVWMKNEVTTIVSISNTHTQPTRRCGIVPLGAASCTAPRPNAPIAANACTWMTAGAARSGASVMRRSVSRYRRRPCWPQRRWDACPTVLCRCFGLVAVAGARAGILTLGGGIAIDQLDDRHRRGVAVAKAGLDDAGV